MIIEARNKKPFIHFGFNRQSIDAYENEVVTLWQDTLYNEALEKPIEINIDNATILEQSISKIVFKNNAIENKNISVVVDGIVSDNIGINVILITADSKKISADANYVTADGKYLNL